MHSNDRRPDRITRRSVLRGAVGGSAALAAYGRADIARASPSSMVIVSSGGKLEEAFIEAYYKPWTAKTGIEILTGPNPPAKLKAMVEANSVEWDVMQVDSTIAATLGRQGLLEPIDYSIVDRSDMIDGLTHQYFISSDVAGTVISWNTTHLKPAAVPQSWAEFWDFGRFGEQRGLLKRADQTLEIALMADGVPPAQLYPLDVDRALRSLDRIKPRTDWWSSGAQGAQILIDGDVAAAMEWSGRVDEPKGRGAPVDFHFNQALFTCDSWVVPKGARDVRRSMEFIAFAMQPDRQAAYSHYIPYGPVNKKALALIEPAVLAKLPSSPQNFPKGVFENFDWWAENGAQTIARFNTWLQG